MTRSRKAWACALLVSLAAAAGCGEGGAKPSKDAARQSVTVVRPERGDVTRTITLPGDLVGLYESALHAKVTGYLKSISVDKGDWVKQGQTLAVIEVPELEQKLHRARARLAVQEGTYERLRRVWDSDHRLVAREDIDIAQGRSEQAKAEVEELEALMGYTRIVAPFDGVVTARFVDPGALIQATGPSAASNAEGSSVAKNANGPILTVADINTLRVYVYVPEEETSLIRVGMPATLRLREFPGRTFQATVTRFATALDLSTRTMLTEVDLDNTKHELYPGMYADVHLEIARHADALKLPSSAVGSSGKDAFVYVVRDGKLTKVPVTTGLSSEGWVEIASGLTGDEQVVATITPALADGKKVHAVSSDPGSANLAMGQ